jgi:hypothetical protein
MNATAFVGKHLKTSYCEKFEQEVSYVFKIEQRCGFIVLPYSWPPGKLHRIARDTHHSLQTRYPVLDEQVDWKVKVEHYQPNFATEKDKSQVDEISNAAKLNPHGRFVK